MTYNVVSKPRFDSAQRDNNKGKAYINETQYFDNVPEIAWNFYIGGYQPAQKWLRPKRPSSELNEHSKTIEEYFWGHPPRTASEASAKIAELTGIKRSLTQTRVFLKNIGMSLRKVGPIPGKALSDDKKTKRRI